MKRTVRDLMKQKDLGRVPSIRHDANLRDALRALDEHQSGALLILDDRRLVGVFAERDLVRAAVTTSRALDLNEEVRDHVAARTAYVTPDYRLEECMAVMARLHIRHLPVLDGETPIALLSMTHIMEALIEDKEFLIGEMIKYVTGSSVVDREGGAYRNPQLLEPRDLPR